MFIQPKISLSLVCLLVLAGAILFSSCDQESIKAKGEVEFRITDAPSDDASVKGVFVTVAEVKVDGEAYNGFQGKQTIDIMAYQNGSVKSLGLAELEAGSYSNVTLILDTETDADGNSPGCYVLTTNDEKENLASSGQSSIEVTSQAAFEVKEDTKSTIIIDFDLRKSIQYDGSQASGPSFAFVSEGELNGSVRVVEENNTGTVNGSLETSIVSNPDKVVVYVYKKGTFNKETETQAQGASNIRFKNAVSSSSAVRASGSYDYTLAFLEEGEYEVCFVAYEEDQDGRFLFDGFLRASTFLGGSVTSEVLVSAGLSASLDLSIIAIIQ